jgi:hypothetical protein
MKTIIISIMTISLTLNRSIVQDERKFATQTIIQFVEGTANCDAYNMNYLLHENFQTLNEDACVSSKSDYMKMLAWKKIGGEKQEVEILFLDITLNTGAAKVRTTSKSGTVESYYHLRMESNGLWQILHVLPYRTIEARNL